MIYHLTIDHGDIVAPRHLRIITTGWPDETDTDQHYVDDGNPIAAAFWLAILTASIGFLIWAAL
ncbi:hypothetical protein [Rhodococcus sp. 1168]|uniref:hypothetical protein n=1 Tax=Rhodococcus sp. 1168 TaxID=2018041 RepID=UPI000A0A3BC3|nr:hypothetical protein [Rhodococcus sp. 1168]ORI13467.1 hypothetical protein BJI47_22755 [Rhodococcus sp. 1168]